MPRYRPTKKLRKRGDAACVSKNVRASLAQVSFKSTGHGCRSERLIFHTTRRTERYITNARLGRAISAPDRHLTRWKTLVRYARVSFCSAKILFVKRRGTTNFDKTSNDPVTMVVIDQWNRIYASSEPKKRKLPCLQNGSESSEYVVNRVLTEHVAEYVLISTVSRFTNDNVRFQ